MKKILSIAGIAAMVIGLNASTLKPLFFAGNYDKVVTEFDKQKATFASLPERQRFLDYAFYVRAKAKLGHFKSSAEAVDFINKGCDEFKITGRQINAVVVLQMLDDHAKVISMIPALTERSAINRAALSLMKLQRWAEAADVAARANYGDSLARAAIYAHNGKSYEKFYEYAASAVRQGTVKKASIAKAIVSRLIATDFTGTDITEAKVKELLQLINRRCSRFLKPGAPGAWDEVIQLVRQTLETY